MCNQERQSWNEKRNHWEWERWWTETETRSEINNRKENSDRYSQERQTQIKKTNHWEWEWWWTAAETKLKKINKRILLSSDRYIIDN